MKKIIILFALVVVSVGSVLAQRPFVPYTSQFARQSFHNYDKSLHAVSIQVVSADPAISLRHPVIGTNDMKAKASAGWGQDDINNCNCVLKVERSLPLKEQSQKPGRAAGR